MIIELCRSNSISSIYQSPTVLSWVECTKAEASILLNQKMENGFYYRVQAEDRTGN